MPRIGRIGPATRCPVASRAARRATGWVVATLALSPDARAERTIPADAYRDRLRGMWFGQLIGNHTGRPFEGTYTGREAAPDEAFAWVIHTRDDDPWTGDDDTAFEYLYLHALESHGIRPTWEQIRGEWDDHVTLNSIFIANRQAKYLMGHGFAPPLTGSYRYNMHAYAIDAQITTESLGALSPGVRQWAIDSVRTFAGVSNEGFALHAAQFYGALYAAAAFETDVDALVLLGQQAVPRTSRTWRAIQQVRDWYADDMRDGVPDWRETRRKLADYYLGPGELPRYRGWFESTVNLACTTLALLYGRGDFEQTVRIAVLSGYDADCNPATAGGLLGLMLGFDGLPTHLTAPATNRYRVLDRPGLPEYDTITGVAARWQAVCERVIVAVGGRVEGGVYYLPDDDPVRPDDELDDPSGPSGLVRAVLNAGGTVALSASIEDHDPLDDRDHLDAIIDGIADLRYNRRLPYDTFDGLNEQPPGGDFYQLDLSHRVRLDGLTFHEGDIRWSDVNGDPRVVDPLGGYFETLDVEIRTRSGWVSVRDLRLSEPLDPFAFYQVVRLTFEPVFCDGWRIRGRAGGSAEYTSIVELAAHGALVADVNCDDAIDAADIEPFVLLLFDPAGYADRYPLCDARLGDLDGNGSVDVRDIEPFIGLLFR